MDITQLREKIDNIDDQLVSLFTQRMEITRDIAAYKKENDLPIYVPARERQKLQEVAKLAGPDMDDYTRVLYSMIFELSRSYQSKQNSTATELYRKITTPLRTPPSCSLRLLWWPVRVWRAPILRLPVRRFSRTP